MNTFYILPVFLSLLAACKTAPNHPVSFSDYFSFENKFILEEKIQIANVSSIDFNSNGDMLLTDSGLNQVLIIDTAGKLKKKLSPEKCHPGFEWSPVTAQYSPRGGILVPMDSVPQGFWFTNEGECITKTAPNTKAAIHHFAISSSGTIFYVLSQYDKTSLFAADSLFENVKEYPIKDDFSQINTRIVGGGIHIIPEGILFASGSSPIFNLYSQKGQLIKTFKYKSEEAKFAQKDLNRNQSVSDFMSIIPTISINVRTFLLENKIIQTYRNSFNIKRKDQEEIGICLLDLNGNQINQEDILTDRRGSFIGLNKYTKQFYRISFLSKETCPECGERTSIGFERYRLK